MKKILIVLSAMLLILSACGKASYKDVSKKTSETLTKLSDDYNYKFVDLKEVDEENIKEFNNALENQEWSYKNIHRFEISTSDNEASSSKFWVAVYEIEGDINKFTNTYCVTDQIALYYSHHNITPAQEEKLKAGMDDLCKSIGADITK